MQQLLSEQLQEPRFSEDNGIAGKAELTVSEDVLSDPRCTVYVSR